METLTKADIAKMLKKSVRTVERLIAAGALPSRLALPGHSRWLKSDILNWLDPRKDSVGFTVDRQDK